MEFEALERLGRLRSTGAISDEEFESEKQRILGAQADAIRARARAVPIEVVPMASPSEWESNDGEPSKIRPILLILLGLVALTAVGVLTYKYVLPQKALHPSNLTSASVKYALRSKVKGIRIAPTTELPPNPHGDDPSCSSYEKTPVGSAAKLVRSKGWHVIAENPAGKLDAVSFVGACAPLSGDVFSPIDGNVGMYEGNELRAVIYGKSLGYVESTDDPTQLRITDKTNERTIGRIVVGPQRVSVQR